MVLVVSEVGCRMSSWGGSVDDAKWFLGRAAMYVQ